MKHLFLIFLLSILTVGGMAQETSSKSEGNGKIDVTFDEKKNETTVKLNETKIFENASESLSMVVVSTFAGKKQSGSPSELLFVLNARSKERRYRIEPQITVTADGEVIRTRQMKNYGSRSDKGQIVEPLLTMMPYDVVVKMGNAKKVVLRIGTTDYELTADNLAVLRDVANRLAP